MFLVHCRIVAGAPLLPAAFSHLLPGALFSILYSKAIELFKLNLSCSMELNTHLSKFNVDFLEM
jgi:hypothetical protein